MRRERATGGPRAAVSAGSAIAGRVAMEILRDGGTAIDAAIAGSAAQCVVEMPWCGVGGDAFVLARTADGEVVGFNGSGAAPRTVLDAAAGLTKVPRFGPVSVAVPAIVDAWSSLHERFGTAAFADLLEPARRLAGDGFALDQRLAGALAHVTTLEGGEQLAPIVAGRDLAGGARFAQPDLAETLEAIAADGRDGFYRGVIAKQIADHLAERGGALGLDDLAAHRGEWVAPLSVPYRGATVHSNGLVSTGVLVLVALRVLEQLWPGGLPADDVAVTDALVRLKVMLFGTVSPALGDPRHIAVPDVLTDGTVERLVAALGADGPPASSVDAPAAADTTSLAVIAPDGSGACIIHSLFNEFGSRELVPDTGIVLNDRLANLVVGDRAGRQAANALVPGRRPMHTLHGYVVEWADGGFALGATPGGRGQVQTNLQILTSVIDRGVPVGQAVIAPRWVHGMPRAAADDDALYLEEGLAPIADRLGELGHVVEVVDAGGSDRFGNCTVVADRGGVLEAAADHRRGGEAFLW
jgi:gamma-glutamyltranspeptidase / glutathione hydrolase